MSTYNTEYCTVACGAARTRALLGSARDLVYAQRGGAHLSVQKRGDHLEILFPGQVSWERGGGGIRLCLTAHVFRRGVSRLLSQLCIVAKRFIYCACAINASADGALKITLPSSAIRESYAQ